MQPDLLPCRARELFTPPGCVALLPSYSLRAALSSLSASRGALVEPHDVRGDAEADAANETVADDHQPVGSRRGAEPDASFAELLIAGDHRPQGVDRLVDIDPIRVVGLPSPSLSFRGVARDMES